MPQYSHPLFDQLGRLMTDAAGVAQGVRREADTLVRAQVDRLLRDADVVSRDEFEAIREMAILARDENELLRVRVAALEAKLAGSHPPTPDRSDGAEGPSPSI